MSACLPCPAGSFCPEGAKAATLCPNRNYSESNAKECKICEVGYYCTDGNRQ